MAEINRKATRQEIRKHANPVVTEAGTAYYYHIVYEDVFSNEDDSLISSRIIQDPKDFINQTKEDLITKFSNPSSKLSISDVEDYARFVTQLENES